MALLFKLDHPAFGAVHRGDACSRLSPLAACAVCGFSDLVLPAPFMPWRFSLAVRGPSQAVVGVHAALENFRIGGSIKEARSDTQTHQFNCPQPTRCGFDRSSGSFASQLDEPTIQTEATV